MYKLTLRRKFKKKFSYLIVLIKIDETKSLNKVIEVIGSYDFLQKRLVINIFRLIYWIAKESAISGKLVNLLYLFGILK